MRFAPWLPIPAFVFLFVLAGQSDTTRWFEPPLLLPVLNLVFVTAVSLFVAYLAGRSYLLGESLAVLLLGSGMAVYGLTTGIAGLTLFAGRSLDTRVTMHNLGALAGGACCLLSALVAARHIRIRRVPARDRRVVFLAFALVLAFVTLLTTAEIDDLLPIFFVAGGGPTLSRQIVLGSAVAMFALAGLEFIVLGRRSPTAFLSWYSLGLLLIALGLSAVFTQHTVGSAVSWAGRAAQYLGCIYVYVALVSVPSGAGAWGIPLDQILRETRDRHRSLVDCLPDAVLVHSDGVYVFANPAAVRLFHARSPEDLVGKRVLDLVHPDDREMVRQRMDMARSGEPTPLREILIRRLDGSVAAVEVTGAGVDFRRKPAVQIVLRDVTERKRVEEALRIQSALAVELLKTVDTQRIFKVVAARLYAVAGGAVVAVSEFDARSRKVTIRAVACREDERRRAIAILGRDPDGLSLDFPEQTRNRWLAGRLAPVPGGLEELLFHQVPADACARLTSELQVGDVFGMACTHEDDLLATVAVVSHSRGPLAQQKLIESMVAEAALALKRARADEKRSEVEERYRVLADELREADRRKDEFIAMLSHELRNPLAPIRYALPQLAQAPLDHSASRAHAVISRQVDHLVRLVDDLLDVSRITRGKIELRPEVVAVDSIVNSAVESVRPLMEAAGHGFTVVVPHQPMWIEVDPHRVSQIITNLLTNAAKYTPPGGQVRLEVAHTEGRLVVRVSDTGMGIAPETIAALFEMFRQGERVGQSQGGLGIGLALSKQLAEMHGGTIEAFSDGPGRGAEFTVRLPAPLVPRHEEPVQASAGVAVARHLKVLIVDDNADLVEMLAMLVGQLGHDARKALDGCAAIREAVSYQPDVVLLDLGLPGMSGLDVARALRERTETAQACLVALTGWGQPEDQRQTREAGFDRHLTKPADPETLERLLAELARR